MMAQTAGDNDEFMLQAYCDGELDPASVLAFEQRMANDAALEARYRNIMALRNAFATLPHENEPPDLLARIETSLEAPRSQPRRWSWQSMAAAGLIGAVLASGVMLTLDRNASHAQLAQQVVDSHIRGLLAPQPFDIASSDRHTVKPWFATHVPASPQVVDLAAQGFPLAGGRVDVIGRDPVATMIYKHAAHVISVITLPPSQQVPDENVAGYNVRSWRDGDFTYVAVSDIPAEELAAFERAFIAALPR